MLLSLKIF